MRDVHWYSVAIDLYIALFPEHDCLLQHSAKRSAYTVPENNVILSP
jgi:hypothetical protein